MLTSHKNPNFGENDRLNNNFNLMFVSIGVFDYEFVDNDVVAVNNSCRNPDNDVKGPWCFTKEQRDGDRETCPIPVCAHSKCFIKIRCVNIFQNSEQ